MSSQINFFHIIKDGFYFSPAWKHYGEHPIDVHCDRCSKKTSFSIGLSDKYDLCLSCVKELSASIKYLDIFTSGIFCCNMISHVSNIICDKCEKIGIKIYVSHNNIALCMTCIEKIMHKSSPELSVVKTDNVEILSMTNNYPFLTQKQQSTLPSESFKNFLQPSSATLVPTPPANQYKQPTFSTLPTFPALPTLPTFPTFQNLFKQPTESTFDGFQEPLKQPTQSIIPVQPVQSIFPSFQNPFKQSTQPTIPFFASETQTKQFIEPATTTFNFKSTC